MRLKKLFLSFATLLALLIPCVIPAWADKIPAKKPSQYGEGDSQILLTQPSFTTLSQNGVTVGLDSVYCNSCNPNDIGETSLMYFFDINLSAGSQLDSLVFGPGFDPDPFVNNFAVVQFDGTIPGDPCFGSGGADVCPVPVTQAGLNFANVESTVVCDANDVCTVSFTGFNPATIGGTGQIILSAVTPFDATSLRDSKGNPATPQVTLSASQIVAVPEPSSLWFAGIALIGCGGLVRKQMGILRT